LALVSSSRPGVCAYGAAIPMQRRGFLQASHGPPSFTRNGPDTPAARLPLGSSCP